MEEEEKAQEAKGKAEGEKKEVEVRGEGKEEEEERMEKREELRQGGETVSLPPSLLTTPLLEFRPKFRGTSQIQLIRRTRSRRKRT